MPKTFCIDLTGKFKNGELYVENTTCIPYHEGIENILETNKTYTATELLNKAYPVFSLSGIYYRKEHDRFASKITEPVEYTLRTRIVDEAELKPATSSKPREKPTCSCYTDALNLIKKSREMHGLK